MNGIWQKTWHNHFMLCLIFQYIVLDVAAVGGQKSLFFKQRTQKHAAHICNLPHQTGCHCKHCCKKQAAVAEHGTNVTAGTCAPL